MITKYTTGQAVLIPATIRNAEEHDGQISYHVDVDYSWDSIPEDVLIVDENAERQKAMASFLRKLAGEQNPRY